MVPDWLLLVLAPGCLLFFLVESFTVCVFYMPNKAKKHWVSVKCWPLQEGAVLLLEWW